MGQNEASLIERFPYLARVLFQRFYCVLVYRDAVVNMCIIALTIDNPDYPPQSKDNHK